MLSLIGCLWAAVALEDPPSIDAIQFAQLVEAQTTALKDIAFIYEGGLRWIGPKSALGRDIGTFESQFQGAYLYRRNDAALADIYVKRGLATSGVERRRTALLRGLMETHSIAADSKRRPPSGLDIQKRSGSFASLGGPASASVLFCPWVLLGIAEEHAGDFHALGWDTIDGRKCLHFRLGDVVATDKSNYEDYWVDMDRSANILKAETFQRGKLVARTDDVRLFKVLTKDQKPYWLPVRARLQGFDWNGTVYGSPIMEEIIEVVDGSILINQGLPDEIFSVRRESGLPGPGELEALSQKAASLKLGQEYHATPEAAPFRVDPAGVREKLDANLAEADRQSKMLEASAPSRDSWTWVGATQILLTVGCIALIGGAIVLRRRAG